MGITRISTSSNFSQTLYNLRQRQVQINTLNEQISSGKKLNRPSDDPIGVTQLLNIQLDGTQNDQYKKNIDAGMAEMDSAFTVIDGLVEVAQRARELAIQSSNASTGTDQMASIERELDGLISHVVQLGNTQFEGRYIFGGFVTNTSAFTQTGNDVTYNGTPTTDPWQRQVQIGKSTFVTINLNGDDIIGDVTVSGAPPTTTGVGLIQALTQFKLDLAAGDKDAIRADIDLIKTSETSVETQQASFAGVYKQMQLTKNRIEDLDLVNAKESQRLQDIDLAKALSDFNFSQTLYQASIQVMSKLLQTSLVNFVQ